MRICAGRGTVFAPPPAIVRPGMMSPMAMHTPRPPMHASHIMPQLPVDGPELWRETKAPDGSVYYYNLLTRQTSWTNPHRAVMHGFYLILFM